MRSSTSRSSRQEKLFSTDLMAGSISRELRKAMKSLGFAVL